VGFIVTVVDPTGTAVHADVVTNAAVIGVFNVDHLLARAGERLGSELADKLRFRIFLKNHNFYSFYLIKLKFWGNV